MTMQLAFETVSQHFARLASGERNARCAPRRQGVRMPHVDVRIGGERSSRGAAAVHAYRASGLRALDDVLTATLLVALAAVGSAMIGTAASAMGAPGAARAYAEAAAMAPVSPDVALAAAPIAVVR